LEIVRQLHSETMDVRNRDLANEPREDLETAVTQNSNDPRTALEQRISLIVHRVNSRFNQIANKLLSTQGISMYDSRILLFLLEREEMRVGELVDAMALPQSTISHQLKQLQARKLIRRRRSRRDSRAVAVMLTPAGEELARASERYSIAVQRCLIDSFSRKEMEQLTTLLNEAFDVLEVSRFSPEHPNSNAMSRPKSLKKASRRKRAM
jgi:DNA-binding MarR family transcriptional regulator